MRDRALFDLAIDSKLRGCDIVKMKIGDVIAGGAIRNRATVMQRKTKRPVQFEFMTEARQTLLTWLNRRGGSHDDFIFPSRVNYFGHLSTRQYARLVDEWVAAVGLNAHEYGTHSMRRTKAAMIYKATGMRHEWCSISMAVDCLPVVKLLHTGFHNSPYYPIGSSERFAKRFARLRRPNLGPAIQTVSVEPRAFRTINGDALSSV